jgi:hypothetical protein
VAGHSAAGGPGWFSAADILKGFHLRTREPPYSNGSKWIERRTSNRSLLAIAIVYKPLTYDMLIRPEAQGKGFVSLLRSGSYAERPLVAGQCHCAPSSNAKTAEEI